MGGRIICRYWADIFCSWFTWHKIYWTNCVGQLVQELNVAAFIDNWQLSLLSTHLQLESWIAEYIQWAKYENMQKCQKSEKKLIAKRKKNNNNSSTSSACGMEIIW